MLGVLAVVLALVGDSVEERVEHVLRTALAGGARAEEATRLFLDAPYLASPLGEGSGRDPDARFRLDAFDCMTLVETAVALGSAGSLEEARISLDDVRYRGAREYRSRNHEVMSQWIPANVAKGWIAEATEALPGASTPRTARRYTRTVRAAGRAIPGAPGDRLPTGRFAVTIVPPPEVPTLARRMPRGTIVFVVRTDAPDRATRVTHAGLLVRRSGGTVLVRHASRSRGIRRVIEEPLDRFLRRQALALPRWPVEGLAFFAIRDNRARVHALAAARRAGTAGGGPLAGPPPPQPSVARRGAGVELLRRGEGGGTPGAVGPLR